MRYLNSSLNLREKLFSKSLAAGQKRFSSLRLVQYCIFRFCYAEEFSVGISSIAPFVCLFLWEIFLVAPQRQVFIKLFHQISVLLFNLTILKGYTVELLVSFVASQQEGPGFIFKEEPFCMKFAHVCFVYMCVYVN